MHVNFGVVADVDVEPGTTWTARAARSVPTRVVAAITGTMVEGHCAAGVAAALKHFPNQGSTVEDLIDSTRSRSMIPTPGPRSVHCPTSRPGAPGDDRSHPLRGRRQRHPASLSGVITSCFAPTSRYDGVIVTDDMHVMRGVGSDSPGSASDRRTSCGCRSRALRGGHDARTSSPVSSPKPVSTLRSPIGLPNQPLVYFRLKGALGLIPGASASWFDWCGAPGARD